MFSGSSAIGTGIPENIVLDGSGAGRQCAVKGIGCRSSGSNTASTYVNGVVKEVGGGCFIDSIIQVGISKGSTGSIDSETNHVV